MIGEIKNDILEARSRERSGKGDGSGGQSLLMQQVK
jgi:hypothetical protein